MRMTCLLALAMVFLTGGFSTRAAEEEAAKVDPAAALEADVTQGALRVVGEGGAILECPLKHTDVQAEISGFIARVTVTQTFTNPKDENIEAVYVFPLPHEGAIDDMTMVIGERKIVGEIKRRAEAERIYQEALAAGMTAALLEQERPNIFTQKVGIIQPGQEVKIVISYVDVLNYDMGEYQFSFPMVVGPRYNPGNITSTPEPAEPGVSPRSPDTEQVPDGSKINPPVLLPGVRNGHDISLTVSLDAGVPIGDLKVSQHEAAVVPDGDRRARVTLSPHDSIPNKDFVLRYKVVGEKPQMAVLAHTGEHSKDIRRLGEGYFMLMVQPAEDERLTKSPPRELVFLVDTSGSMRGEPTAKVQDAMKQMLKLCREQDTVQVVTFASQAHSLFEKPVPVNDENITKALNFMDGVRGGGGTEMLKGVQMAIDQPIDKERLRIVVMLTDGYIGNEAQIIEHVGKHCGDQIRFWAIGIGSSPNMFLIDGVAKQGGGMGKHLTLQDDTVPLTQEIMTRIQRAQLAKVQINWGGLDVCETYPAKIPELWAGRPIILFGRYRDGGAEEISITGLVEGEAAEWKLAVDLPKAQEANGQLAKVWARKKIEDLMQQAYYGTSPPIEEEVTALALDYRLMSQYTSFVAVDQDTARMSDEPVTPPRRMAIPVPLPAGTSWEGFFGGGDADREVADALSAAPRAAAPALRADMLPRGRETLSRLSGTVPQSLRLGDAQNKQFAGRANWSAQPTSPAQGLYGGGFGGGGMAGKGRGLQQFGVQSNRRQALAQQNGQMARKASAHYFAQPLAELPASGLGLANGRARLLKDVAEKSKSEGGEVYEYTTGSALQQQAAPLRAAGQAALEEARKLAADGKPAAEIRPLLERAILLDSAAASMGMSDGSVTAAALGEIEAAHAKQVEAWKKDFPALARKLDLVIRDKSLAEALAELAKAGGIEVNLVEGSAADAASLLGGEEVRISFLDLRNATVAQALDWLVQPYRLDWSVGEGGAARVASSARRGGSYGWVYDVASASMPRDEEFKDLDPQKAFDAAKTHAENYRAAVAKAAGLEGELQVSWFSPGQLLVFGEPKAHAAAKQLIEKLAAKDSKFEEAALTELHARTSKRAAARAELAKLYRETSEVFATLGTHEYFGWQLLAAALDNRLDLEALTELQIAWNAPQTGKILTDAPSLALRSWWCVNEAARLLPEEAELVALRDKIAPSGREAFAKSVAALKEQPEDESHRSAVLYGALAQRGDAAAVANAVAILGDSGEEAGSLRSQASHLSRALLGKTTSADYEALLALAENGMQGDDLVALTAWACYRVGGDTWKSFRAQSRELLAKQPLSGHVLMFVNRLEGSDLR